MPTSVGRGPTAGASPNEGPMPWASSAADGWTRRTGRWCRVSAPRHHHGGPGGAGRTFWVPVRAGRCRHHHRRDRQAVGLRCLSRPSHYQRQVRAARGGAPDRGGAGFPAPGGGGPGRRLPVPGLRPSPWVVRCPPRSTLGRRKADLALQPGPAVPASSPVDPSGVRGGHGPREPVFLRPDGTPLEDRAPPATCGR